MNRPKIFIASSSESLPITNAINANLDHEFEVTTWNSGTFTLSTTSIDALVKKSSSTDFAAFVFNPDDLTVSRGASEQVVRDNVLFELGLFIGAIGVERCFVVKPRGIELKLPSDLLGLTMADYDPQRSDGNLDAALRRACYEMAKTMNALGALNRVGLSNTQKLAVNPQQYSLNTPMLKVLAACLETHTSMPGGKVFNQISYQIKNMEEESIRIQLIRLERMFLIERAIAESDYDGGSYYVYRITESGVDCVLDNENLLEEERNNLREEEANRFKDIPF